MTPLQYSQHYTNVISGVTKVSLIDKIRSSYAQAVTFGLAASVEYIVNKIKRTYVRTSYKVKNCIALAATFGFVCGFITAIILYCGVL